MFVCLHISIWLSQLTPCSAALLLVLGGGAVWPELRILAVELTADESSLEPLVLITASFGLQAPPESAAPLLRVLHNQRGEPRLLQGQQKGFLQGNWWQRQEQAKSSLFPPAVLLLN